MGNKHTRGVRKACHRVGIHQGGIPAMQFGLVQNETYCHLKFKKMRKRLKTQPKNKPSSTSKFLIPSQHICP